MNERDAEPGAFTSSRDSLSCGADMQHRGRDVETCWMYVGRCIYSSFCALPEVINLETCISEIEQEQWGRWVSQERSGVHTKTGDSVLYKAGLQHVGDLLNIYKWDFKGRWH